MTDPTRAPDAYRINHPIYINNGGTIQLTGVHAPSVVYIDDADRTRLFPDGTPTALRLDLSDAQPLWLTDIEPPS